MGSRVAGFGGSGLGLRGSAVLGCFGYLGVRDSVKNWGPANPKAYTIAMFRISRTKETLCFLCVCSWVLLFWRLKNIFTVLVRAGEGEVLRLGVGS